MRRLPVREASASADRGLMADWLHWLETVPSTNSWAMEQGSSLSHGDVVFTPRQTAGRGQFDRSWQSPPGVLTTSVILDGLTPAQQVGFSLVAGLSLIYSLEDLLPSLGSKLQLKWPNDLWYQQRKLAGILCEAKGERLIVGIGCNLQADFSEILTDQIGRPFTKCLQSRIDLHQIDPPGFLALSSQSEDYRIVLLTKLRRYLLEAAALIQARGLNPLLPVLQQRDGLRGRDLTIELPSGSIAGKGAGIDALGRLQISLPEAPAALALACASARIVAVTAGRVRL
jgi:BirA family transcriptional regulator, biotin operon repressor / biotin---[acetyl-CoA-carboxylase] ligase